MYIQDDQEKQAHITDNKDDSRKCKEEMRVEFMGLLREGSELYAIEASKNAMNSYQKALEILTNHEGDVSKALHTTNSSCCPNEWFWVQNKWTFFWNL